MKYVALLRGINVGGNSKVAMADLKAMFGQLGLQRVQTYIQSGNVLFEAPEQPTGQLARLVERKIASETAIATGVVIISEERFTHIIGTAPDWWGTGDGWKYNLFVLLEPNDMPAMLAALSDIDPALEHIAPGDGVVYQSLSTTIMGKPTTSRLAASPLYKRLTVRNYNTSKKLLELLHAQ